MLRRTFVMSGVSCRGELRAAMNNTSENAMPAPARGAASRNDDEQRLHARLARIQRKILVLSGKGGVGKSTVAVHLATALLRAGNRVGLLDVDIHGPSIPTMLGVRAASVNAGPDGWQPIDVHGLQVMSLAFLLQNRDAAVIWRGPLKMNIIRRFLSDVAWNALDYLVVDTPPGTGDEPLSVCQLMGNPDGAVIVTTPQLVALVDVRKTISFCRRLQLPILGIVENMCAFVCPHCHKQTPLFGSGGGERLAAETALPFLGSIPFDPTLAAACDDAAILAAGRDDAPVMRIMRAIIHQLAPPDA